MSRMPRAKSISEIYHIIIRGTGQQILFESKSDGQFFLNMLKKYAREADIVLYGYCLMDNHVHLLLQGKQPMLSDFMKRLCGNYASYFNNKYDRVGTLFQSRFRSEPIEDDRYFLTVLRYIIMNPERAGVCQRDRYGWSCYKEYFLQPAICDTSFASRICGSEDALQQFLRSEPQDSAVLKPKGRVSDADAKKIIKTLFDVDSGIQLQSLERTARDRAIVRLKRRGLSTRQIERLTGISRGAVQRA